MLAIPSALVMQSCTTGSRIESWRQQQILGGGNPYVTEQGAHGTQSGVGRLNNVQGTIEDRKGYYYLRSSDTGRLWELSNQNAAKKFANSKVSVWGFFNYDQGMIDVDKIYPLTK
jgi:hypothetical protein